MTTQAENEKNEFKSTSYPYVLEESDSDKEFKVYQELGREKRNFEDRIEMARTKGDTWLEVSDTIVNHYNPKGMGQWGYFIYKGIKCCLKGTLQEIKDRLELTATQLMHGKEFK